MEKKYMVSAGSRIAMMTDKPNVAIKYWFLNQKHYPTDVAILALTKDAAKELIGYAHDNKSSIEELSEKYKNPYKLSFMLEAIDKKYTDECSGFCGTFDQVHPFDFG